MKAFITQGIAAGATLGIALLAVFLLREFVRPFRDLPRKRKVGSFFLIWLGCYLVGFLLYFGRYYHAGDRAAQYMESRDGVTVTQEKGVIAFDGPGEADALILYPGAKVAAAAYAPLTFQLAAQGVDCFIVEMPFHMAFFGIGRAGGVMESHPGYEHWYLGGHSLGGAMAMIYLRSHPEQLSGCFFLASYPSIDMEQYSDIKFYTIYGTEDGVMNRPTYQASRYNWPDNAVEAIIEGGNHAQFGDYGFQPGDNPATISQEEQQAQTCEILLDMVFGETETEE